MAGTLNPTPPPPSHFYPNPAFSIQPPGLTPKIPFMSACLCLCAVFTAPGGDFSSHLAVVFYVFCFGFTVTQIKAGSADSECSLPLTVTCVHFNKYSRRQPIIPRFMLHFQIVGSNAALPAVEGHLAIGYVAARFGRTTISALASAPTSKFITDYQLACTQISLGFGLLFGHIS